MNKSEPKVDVLIDMQLSDLVRANIWFFYSKWSTRIMTLLLILLGIPFTLAFMLIEDSLSIEYALFPFVLISLAAILPMIVYFQTKRTFSSLKEFQKHVRYTFSADGYDVSDEKSSAHISWESILKAVETKHSFNLFFQKVLFYTIPKRCFQQAADVQLMRDILKRSLGKKAEMQSD